MSELYRTAMGIQSNLDVYPSDSPIQNFIKHEGMQKINDAWTPHRRLLSTDRMYFMPDGLSQQSDDAVEFTEAKLTADIPGFVIAKIGVRNIISLRCFESVVLGPADEIESVLVDMEMDISGANTVLQVGVRIRRPLYVPVEDVTFITLAA
jgi:hypothetical protein